MCHSTLAGLGAILLSVVAAGQESSSTPVLVRTPSIQGTTLAPNFRVAAFRAETPEEDNASPDAPSDASTDPAVHEGLVKRSIKRIGADQKRLYLAPFEAHNLKWDLITLLGTAPFLPPDHPIKNNIPHSHLSPHHAISDPPIAVLS